MAGKKDELARITSAKKKAQKDADDIAKKQFLLDTTLQTVSLITSSINIIKGFSSIPIVGLPLGIAAVAAMFAFFASAKAKAFSAIGNTAERGAVGTKTGMVQGRRHIHGGERFTDHLEIEAGEKWGILSRGATSKHGQIFEEFTHGLNEGRTPNDLMLDLLHGTGVTLKGGIAKRVQSRGNLIHKQELFVMGGGLNQKMADSMANVDQNLSDLKDFEMSKPMIIETPTGRWEIDLVKKKKTFIRYTNGDI